MVPIKRSKTLKEMYGINSSPSRFGSCRKWSPYLDSTVSLVPSLENESAEEQLLTNAIIRPKMIQDISHKYVLNGSRAAVGVRIVLACAGVPCRVALDMHLARHMVIPEETAGDDRDDILFVQGKSGLYDQNIVFESLPNCE